MRLPKIVLSLLLMAAAGLGQEAHLQFEQANELYRKGEYSKAAAAYEQTLNNGYESPTIYYNIGNAYFKLNKIAPAILNFERALRISPTDEDIAYNLRLTNLRVVDKIEPLPRLFFVQWWESLTNSTSADGWAIVMITGIWIIAVCTGVLFVIRSPVARRAAASLIAAGCIVLVVSLVSALQRSAAEDSARFAIVFQPTGYVKSSPDIQSTDLFVLHEGVKVEVLDSVGDWRKIRLADGKVGWLPAASIQVI
jgi:tetratricopeptide (TPR) repeat protein